MKVARSNALKYIFYSVGRLMVYSYIINKTAIKSKTSKFLLLVFRALRAESFFYGHR